MRTRIRFSAEFKAKVALEAIKPLFTATATGSRNGHTEASDRSVRADLSPKAMGGPGNPNTPKTSTFINHVAS